MKKSILIPILVVSAVITAGILAFSFISYGTQGSIDASSDYAYASSSSGDESVMISADMCDITIEYNSTSMEYGMEAYFTAEIEGLFVKGRVFEEFFQYPHTQNLSDVKSIIFSTHEDLFKNPLNLFSNKDLEFTIKLRTDLEYNINIDVAVGDISMDVPVGVSLGDVNLESDVGDVSLNAHESNFNGDLSISSTTGKVNVNLNNSTIAGDISASTMTGSTRVSLVNLSYLTDTNLDIGTTTGSIYLTIDQRVNMGAMVSGSLTVTTGNIAVNYYDNSDELSLNCVSSTTTGNADQYTSPEYPTTYCYDLRLQTTTGNIDITATEN